MPVEAQQLGGRRDSVASMGSTFSGTSAGPRFGGAARARMRVAPSVVPGGVSSPLLPRAPPSRQPHGSRCRLYARVAACFVGSMLSSGVLVSFPTLEPILLDQRPGVGAALFASHCTAGWADDSGSMDDWAGGSGSTGGTSSSAIYACNKQKQLAQTLYSVSLGISTVATLFLGYIYDKKGPRFAGVFGALLCAACFVLITVSLTWPALNGLIWLAVPLCDCAGGLVSLAMWGFTWHLPDKQATVSSLYMASMSISFCMALLATYLVDGDRVHVDPKYVWLVYSALAVLSAILIGACAPSSAEFHREASLVTGVESKPPESHVCKTSGHVLHAWSHNCARNVLFNLFATMTYCWVGAWASSYVQLVDLTLEPTDARRMLQLFAIVGGVVAGVVQPVIGYIFDKIGLRLFFAIVNVALLVNIFLMDTAVQAFRPFRVQVIVLIISSFVQSSWAVVIMQWNIYFVPPALNGTAIGVTFAFAGVAQMITVAASPKAMEVVSRLFDHPHDVHGHHVSSHSFTDLEKLLYPILAFGVIGVFFGILCNALLLCKGIPKETPSLESITSRGQVYSEIKIGGSANKRRARGSLAKITTVN